MSGTIFMSSENSEELHVENKWNPLHCHLCHEQYQDPCILQCYHSFCAKCLENKVEDGNLACPLCGAVTLIKEDNVAPPPDALLKFLVESSSGDKTPCANCDQVDVQMYFCSTCSQSLCVECREETHQAKMFQSHEILLQTKHTRDIQKQCSIHKEPYILFSTEKKVMLCINCFRDMKVESRSHCVDLETAYKQGCQKLDDTMQSIRDLQNSVRDGILLLRALLEEIESNVEKEKGDIQELYSIMQEKISETKEALLTEIDRQYEEKVELFKNQLISLTTFLPTLHVHLVTCAAFSSSANKYEFLDFTYVLMKRLMSIIQVQHPLHPSQTSDIVTDYKAKFAKCLEPLLFPHRNGAPVAVPTTIVPSVACTRYDVSPSITSPAVSSSSGVSGSEAGQRTSMSIHNKKKFKRKLMETKGFFTDHCKEFDTAHMDFMQKVEGIKQSVQELQRDITLRRSLTKEATINELKSAIALAEEGLVIHQVNVESKQKGLEEHWEESLERLAGEQEVYQAQLQDVGRLKSEVAAVKIILQKLSSFVTSIASVTQRLAPKLSKATLAAEHDSSHAAILQEINTMQPDSQQRVDAISKAQEVRDYRTANRVNPLDEELIKTKGLLRAPSERKESTMKRLSAEIKDVKIEDSIKENQNSDKEMSGSSLDENENGSAGSQNLNTSNQSVDIKGHHDSESKELVASEETLNQDSKEMITADEENVEVRINGDSQSTDEGDNSIRTESQLDTEMVSDSSVKDVSAGACCNDLSATSSPVSLPDVMIQVAKDKESTAADINEIVDNQAKDSDASKELTVEVAVPEASGSESDLNTSTDSVQSSEEGVKPGLVKDLIAMVDGRTKPSGGVSEVSDVKTSNGNRSPNVKVSETEMNGFCDDTSMKYDISVNAEVDEKEDVSGDDLLSKSPEENMKVPKCVDSVARSPDSTSADDDEIYVTKSLPELAQVFEPGQLKQKRKRSRSSKAKEQ